MTVSMPSSCSKTVSHRLALHVYKAHDIKTRRIDPTLAPSHFSALKNDALLPTHITDDLLKEIADSRSFKMSLQAPSKKKIIPDSLRIGLVNIFLDFPCPVV